MKSGDRGAGCARVPAGGDGVADGGEGVAGEAEEGEVRCTQHRLQIEVSFPPLVAPTQQINEITAANI